MATAGYQAIDRFVGARIRERRLMLGLSQRELAETVGTVTQQMIYKYELGHDAVAASRLYEIAGALGTSVNYFFDSFERNEAAQRSAHPPLLLKLMRSFSEIESEAHRDAISYLIRALATNPERPKRGK